MPDNGKQIRSSLTHRGDRSVCQSTRRECSPVCWHREPGGDGSGEEEGGRDTGWQPAPVIPG